MHIVFEGPDCSGKSSLLEAVAKELDMPCRKRIVRVGPENILEVNREDLEQEGSLLLDRCYWISDIIYEPFHNVEGSALLPLDRKLYDVGDAFYIHVTCSSEVMQGRLEERGDELFDETQIEIARRRYIEFFEHTFGREHLTIDTTEVPFEENVKKIVNKIKEVLKCK